MSTLLEPQIDLPEKSLVVGNTKSLSNVTPPKLLALSFSYPPQTEPRAIQVSRLLKHLNASTVLVCQGDTDSDDSQSFLEKTVRVPLPKSSWRSLLDRVSRRVYVPIWSRTPDPLVSWRRPVLQAIEHLITLQHYKPDVLVTFAFPLIDSVIGLELKQRYGFPWIAHFSDPWVDSPFRNDDRLTRALNARLEQKVMENADRIVFTSEETAELVMRKYRSELRSKVRIVPHAFEADLFPRAEGNGSGCMIVRYLGDLYLGRTPKPLFKALEVLSSTEPSLLKEFRFEIVGEVHELDLEQMGVSRLPEGLVVVRPRVGYRESLSLMTSASGLMVIDAPVPKNTKSVFLPSKLIEYVGAGRPIVGLTPPGTAADLIEKLGGWVADPSDTDQLVKVMRQFLLFLQGNTQNVSAIWGRSEVREQFEATTVATKFQQVLMELS